MKKSDHTKPYSTYEKLQDRFGDEFPNAIGGIASAYHILTITDPASEYYEHGLSVEPENPYFHAGLGLLHLSLGNNKKDEK